MVVVVAGVTVAKSLSTTAAAVEEIAELDLSSIAAADVAKSSQHSASGYFCCSAAAAVELKQIAGKSYSASAFVGAAVAAADSEYAACRCSAVSSDSTD